ncbi:MAG: hypothetical protein FWH56_09400 [Betaproteobacteria bacterium]|nr:hypothetical protein [Betaproteobacteria bacterium]MCL2162078.1 hypothetical protein [Betaproteobacteria bacterium]
MALAFGISTVRRRSSGELHVKIFSRRTRISIILLVIFGAIFVLAPTVISFTKDYFKEAAKDYSKEIKEFVKDHLKDAGTDYLKDVAQDCIKEDT